MIREGICPPYLYAKILQPYIIKMVEASISCNPEPN